LKRKQLFQWIYSNVIITMAKREVVKINKVGYTAMIGIRLIIL
jgi:hypothetical protein